jgi:hypothetical protein
MDMRRLAGGCLVGALRLLLASCAADAAAKANSGDVAVQATQVAAL